MIDKRKEELSALMDGEASELELRRVLKALEQDPNLNSTWEGYHLIRSALQDHSELPLDIDISERVSIALDAEQPLFEDDPESPTTGNEGSGAKSMQSSSASGPHHSALGRLWQPLTQTAVAASVAMVAVLVWQDMRFDSPSSSVRTDSASMVTNNASGSAGFQNFPGVMPFSRSDFGSFISNQPNTSPVGYGPMGPVASQPNFKDMELVKSGTIGEQSSRNTNLSEDYQKTLDAYFVTHTGNAAINAPQGMMPFARVVDIDVEDQ